MMFSLEMSFWKWQGAVEEILNKLEFLKLIIIMNLFRAVGWSLSNKECTLCRQEDCSQSMSILSITRMEGCICVMFFSLMIIYLRYFPHRSLHVKVGSEVNHIFIQDDSLKQCQKLVACLLQDLTKYWLIAFITENKN